MIFFFFLIWSLNTYNLLLPLLLGVDALAEAGVWRLPHAGPSLLQRPHHRARLGLAAKIAAPWGQPGEGRAESDGQREDEDKQSEKQQRDHKG